MADLERRITTTGDLDKALKVKAERDRLIAEAAKPPPAPITPEVKVAPVPVPEPVVTAPEPKPIVKPKVVEKKTAPPSPFGKSKNKPARN